MSTTYCRFCQESFEGIYINCPKCTRNLIPVKYQSARGIIESFGARKAAGTDASPKGEAE